MKVFRYFEPVFLLCVLQLLVEFPCQGETHLGHSNVKSSAKNSIPRKNGSKNVLEKDLTQGTTSEDFTGENNLLEKKIGSSGFLETDKSGSHKDRNLSHKKDVPLHKVVKADDKFTKPSVQTHQTEKSRELKNKSVANGKSKRRLTHAKKSKLTKHSAPVKPDDFHQKGTTKKKKKKSLFTANRSVRLLTDLLNEVLQSSVWQTGVSSLYSCGGLQHFPFLILSMPSGKEMTAAFSLHTPLIYLPNEQFVHPGPLRVDSQSISLHLSFPEISRRQS